MDAVTSRGVGQVARNNTITDDLRPGWAARLAPYVVAAREGAAEAARTARREREQERKRALREAVPRGQRLLVVAAAGLAVVGAVGAVAAMLANRQPGGTDRAGAEPAATDQLKSAMEAGRDKVTGMARGARHKAGGGGPTQAGEGSSREPETTYASPEAASARSHRGTAPAGG